MASTPTETERRLVNCYAIHGLRVTERHVWWDHHRCADGDPDRALSDARRAGADGLLIIDVRTGEPWFVDIRQQERHDLERSVARRNELDDFYRARGWLLCWCDQWIDPAEAIEGTCGDSRCIRSEAMDRAGMVP